MTQDLKKNWWQPGLVFFTQATGLIVGPLLIALFLGRYLDGKWHSAPWIFLGLSFLAFSISCVSLVIMAKKYYKQVEKDIPKKDE